MNADLLNSDEFNNALLDYYYLINSHYPERSTLKLVGDRFKLVSELRTVLYRGVFSKEMALIRKTRLTAYPENILVIDGYNVLFTLLNYRLGHFVFISNDNICRDAGSLFGKIKKESLFTECAIILVEFLSTLKDSSMIIYLDSPVSSSAKHKSLLNDLLFKKQIKSELYIVKSADYAINQHKNCTVASSDSVLIDANRNPIFDIPRAIIERKYSTVLFSIQSRLDEIRN